jgi:hypothetical protein
VSGRKATSALLAHLIPFAFQLFEKASSYGTPEENAYTIAMWMIVSTISPYVAGTCTNVQARNRPR